MDRAIRRGVGLWGLLALVLGAADRAEATFIVQTAEVDVAADTLSYLPAGTFDQFNPRNGTLLGVTLQYSLVLRDLEVTAWGNATDAPLEVFLRGYQGAVVVLGAGAASLVSGDEQTLDLSLGVLPPGAGTQTYALGDLLTLTGVAAMAGVPGFVGSGSVEPLFIEAYQSFLVEPLQGSSTSSGVATGGTLHGIVSLSYNFRPNIIVTAVPEPSTASAAALGLGALGLVWVSRRSRVWTSVPVD